MQMTKLQRINNFVTGVIMLLFCVLLVALNTRGYPFIILVLSVMMLFGAIRMLWYYFSIARMMVGGKWILYQGVVYLDLALFTFSLTDVPLIYVTLYLVVVNAVAGIVDMGLAINAKRSNAPSWKLKFSAGFIELGMALLCLLNIRSTSIVVYIFAAGVAYGGLVRIISAFRKSGVVYIQ